MTSDHLVELLHELDAPQHRYTQLSNYFEGNSPLSYLSADAKAALAKFDRMSSNLCRTAVVSLVERLRLAGFTPPDAWDLFLASNLDQLSAVAHRDALVYGTGYIFCWTDQRGRPRATVESPRQVAVQRDPVTSDVVAAVKRVRTKTTTESWLYLPDRIEHWRAQTPGAATAGFTLVKVVDNPLDVVPLVPLGLDDTSILVDLLPIQDSLNKLLLDMMVASEYTGRPRRWATGVELIEKPLLDEDGEPVIEAGEPVLETVNPYPEANRMFLAENAQAHFGQLPAADLAGFEAGVRIIISQAMMTSGLPAHYVGALQDSVTSADALRAAEAALVSRAEAKQLAFGTGWENVAKILLAIRDGAHPNDIDARVTWAPADTRSQAQEADAAQKLYAAGLLSRTTTLRKLGFTDDEIAEELRLSTTENPNKRTQA